MLITFAQDLPDDVLSRSVQGCVARDALRVSGTCRALRCVAAATAQRLFAELFGSADVPACLLDSRPRLFGLLDRARSADPAHACGVFAWAASFGYAAAMSRMAARWTGRRARLLDFVGSEGNTPLVRAARHGCGEAVALLLELSAEVDHAGKGGLTPLFAAARIGEPGIVHMLLDGGASPVKVNKKGDCPLAAPLHAKGGATPGRVESLRLMASRLDAKQCKCSAATRALLAACESGATPYVEVMIGFGVGPADLGMPARQNAPTQAANAPQAVHYTPPTVVADLAIGAVGTALQHRRPPSAPAASRPRSAARGDRRPAAPAAPNGGLAGAGANPAEAVAGGDAEATTPLLVAAGKGFGEIVSLLLKHDQHSRACINAVLPSGKCSLFLAAERGDTALCAKLLAAGALLEISTFSGRSALHAAVEHCVEEVVEVLCDHAEVRHLVQKTTNGESPVMIAERRGKPSLILPMLLCYHRLAQKAYVAGQLGGPDDNVTEPYLTTLCMRYRDLLFQEGGEGCNEQLAQPSRSRCLSQTAIIARCKPFAACDPKAAEEKCLKEVGAAQAPGSLSSRYQRACEQTTWQGPGGIVDGRGRFKTALDLSVDETKSDKAMDTSNEQGRLPRPLLMHRPRAPLPAAGEPAAASGGAASSSAGGDSRARMSSQPASTPRRRPASAAAGTTAGYRSSSARGLPRIENSQRRAPVPVEEWRGPTEKTYWDTSRLRPRQRKPSRSSVDKAASERAAAPLLGASSRAGSLAAERGAGAASATASATETSPGGGAPEPWVAVHYHAAAHRREEAALDADDAMEALLAGYLSDGSSEDGALVTTGEGEALVAGPSNGVQESMYSDGGSSEGE